ncbi:MAG: DUF2911 domain-containing protein [Bacteroidota bacterium]
MKKFALLFSLLALTISFVACGGGEATQVNNTAEEPKEKTPAPAEETAPAPTVVAETGSYKTVILEDGIKSPRKEMTGAIGTANITVNYGSPSLRGRDILTLTPHGELWRTGANMATIFEVSKDVMVEGKELKAGKYSLFTIPGEEEWVVAFNEDTDQGGTRSYKEDKDALRVTVKPEATATTSEAMEFVIEGDEVALQWGNTKVPFAIKG